MNYITTCNLSYNTCSVEDIFPLFVVYVMLLFTVVEFQKFNGDWEHICVSMHCTVLSANNLTIQCITFNSKWWWFIHLKPQFIANCKINNTATHPSESQPYQDNLQLINSTKYAFQEPTNLNWQIRCSNSTKIILLWNSAEKINQTIIPLQPSPWTLASH